MRKGPLLCPAAFLRWVFPNIPFTFPLLEFFHLLSYFFHLVTWISKFPFTWNYTLIHNSMDCLRGPLLCPAASWCSFSNNPFSFSFAINIPFTFSFAKVFSFTFLFFHLITWISKFSFTWNYTLTHNSMVCLRGPLLCPAASWCSFSNNPFSFSFAINIPFTFSFVKVCFSFN